jgi:hypothetical protein
LVFFIQSSLRTEQTWNYSFDASTGGEGGGTDLGAKLAGERFVLEVDAARDQIADRSKAKKFRIVDFIGLSPLRAEPT